MSTSPARKSPKKQLKYIIIDEDKPNARDELVQRLRKPSEPDEERVAKNQRRKERADLMQKLKIASKNDPKQRNPIVIEVVETFLGKSIKVFHARWNSNTCLTEDIFKDTPLFWYKRHKWSSKDIREFFKIMGVQKPNLDAELNAIFNKKKYKKKKKKKKKHLRKKSMQNLAKIRSKTVRHIHSRSMVVYEPDKLEKAVTRLWQLLTKSYDPNGDHKELNHAQFNICLNENKIEVDPDISVDLFYELIVNSEEYDKYKEYKTQKKKERHHHSDNSDHNDLLSPNINTNSKNKKRRKSGSKKKRKSGGKKHLDIGSISPNGSDNNNSDNNDKLEKLNKNDSGSGLKTQNTDKIHKMMRNKRFQSDLLTVKQALDRGNKHQRNNSNSSIDSGSDSDDDEIHHSPHLKLPNDNITISDLKASKIKLDESLSHQTSDTDAEAEVSDDAKRQETAQSPKTPESPETPNPLPTLNTTPLNNNSGGKSDGELNNNNIKPVKEKHRNNPMLYNPEREEIEKSEDFTKIKNKKIKKQIITKQHIKKIMKACKKLIKQQDHNTNASELSFKKRNLVIFQKIMQHVVTGTPFDVMNDYLSERLSVSEMENISNVLDMLESRKTDWRHRLQILEFIENSLDTENTKMEPFYDTSNFLTLIMCWTTQLYDDRSNVTKAAAELFPSVLASLIRRIDSVTILFDKENEIVKTILESFFVLLRNRRAKQLADIAHDAIIAAIDILATVAEDCDDESMQAFHSIMDTLCDHTKLISEKHDVVRAGCISYAAYIIYGIQKDEAGHTPIPSPRRQSSIPLEKKFSEDVDDDNSADNGNGNDNEKKFSEDVDDDNSADNGNGNDNDKDKDSKDDEKEKEKEKEKETKDEPRLVHLKIAKIAEREFLLKDKLFLSYFDKMLLNGVNDKGKEVRDRTMKVLKKMESQYSTLIKEELDHAIFQKYQKWKKFNGPKKKRQGLRQRAKISRPRSIKKQVSQESKDENANENNNEIKTDTNVETIVANESNNNEPVNTDQQNKVE